MPGGAEKLPHMIAAMRMVVKFVAVDQSDNRRGKVLRVVQESQEVEMPRGRKEVGEGKANGRAEKWPRGGPRRGARSGSRRSEGGAQIKKTPVPSMEITCWICHGLYFSDK